MISLIATIIACLTIGFAIGMMVWPCFEGKEKSIKELEIPPEHLLEILNLCDHAQKDKDGKKDLLICYKLWARIREIYPETRIGEWRWVQHGDQLFVVQTRKKVKLLG